MAKRQLRSKGLGSNGDAHVRGPEDGSIPIGHQEIIAVGKPVGAGL